MSLSAAAIDALVSLGLTAEQLAVVVKAEIEAQAAADEARREAKRAGNAERQARFKAKHRDQGNASNALPASASVTAKGPLVPPNEETSNPPLIPQNTNDLAPAPLSFGLVAEVVRLTAAASIAAAKAAKAAGYHRLPATWEPPADMPPKVAAKVALWPPGMLDDLADRFRGWAANAKNENGKGRKLDWDLAWFNWLRDKHDEWQRTRPRFGSNQRPGTGKRTVANLVHDRLAGMGG